MEKSSTISQQTAIDILTKDHATVKKLFKKYESLIDNKGSKSEKQEVANSICQELTVHATIEEELFYPRVRKALKEKDLVDEAEVEHMTVKDLISQIESMDPDEEFYDAKVTVLAEYVQHHVKEEEDEMFPKVLKEKIDLQKMGEEMTKRKTELIS